MLRQSRNKLEWDVRISALARNSEDLISCVISNRNMKSNPEKPLIALSVGDPTSFGNLKPPQQVLDAIHESIDSPNSRSYGPAIGYLEARKAVAEYSAHQGVISADEVILSSGCSQAIEMVIAVLAEAGQNILLPRPGYMRYKTQAEGLGITVKYYDLLPNQNWKIDINDLEKQIDIDTALLVVTNPSNPCGSVYEKEHLVEILKVASRNRVPILSDEVYEHFVFPGRNFTALSSLSTDVPVLTCSGLTKRFLVPGWRMGWLIIHDRNDILGSNVRKGLNNFASRIMGPSTLIQRALPIILKFTPLNFFDEMMLFIASQAKLAYEELRQVPGLKPIMPQGAMYMMIAIDMELFPQFSNDLEFIECMISEESVFCLPGQCFAYPNYFRIVLTVPEHILREACQRIAVFCKKNINKQRKK